MSSAEVSVDIFFLEGACSLRLKSSGKKKDLNRNEQKAGGLGL